MSEISLPPIPDLNKPCFSIFPGAKSLVSQRICPTCEKPVDFSRLTVPVEVSEYSISGMCKDCQDDVFREE